MKSDASPSETNIHLRARAEDKALIDQVAALMGINRTQFLMGAALKEAKNYLLDQTTIEANSNAFQEILDWMDTEPTAEEKAGMERLMRVETFSKRD